MKPEKKPETFKLADLNAPSEDLPKLADLNDVKASAPRLADLPREAQS